MTGRKEVEKVSYPKIEAMLPHFTFSVFLRMWYNPRCDEEGGLSSMENTEYFDRSNTPSFTAEIHKTKKELRDRGRNSGDRSERCQEITGFG